MDLNFSYLMGITGYTASNLLRERDGIEYTMMMLMEGGDRATLTFTMAQGCTQFQRS